MYGYIVEPGHALRTSSSAGSLRSHRAARKAAAHAERSSARRKQSDAIGNDVRFAVFARQKLISFRVADKLHFRTIETQVAIDTIRYVAEMAKRRRERRFLDLGVQELAI